MAKALATASVIMAKKIVRTRRLNRPISAASTMATVSPAAIARRDRVPAGAQARQRDGHAIGADAEEHGVGEGHDAGVAQQQVEARRQHDEDADLGGDVQRLGAGEQEGRDRQAQHDGHQQHGEPAAARQVVGEERAQHGYLLATGKRPCGRHSRIIAISRMLEPSATLGARKPM